jgi:hypothetical protein
MTTCGIIGRFNNCNASCHQCPPLSAGFFAFGPELTTADIQLAVERISRAFSRSCLKVPAYIFAPDSVPDSALIRVAAECEAGLIQRETQQLIPAEAEKSAKTQSECAFPEFYGLHSCPAHPPCMDGYEVLEICKRTDDGFVAEPLAQAPCVYFDYIAQNVPVQRPQSAKQIVQGMLDSPFHREVLDGRINMRTFLTNFGRISAVMEKVTMRVKSGDKEVRYALRCRYRLLDSKGRE